MSSGSTTCAVDTELERVRGGLQRSLRVQDDHGNLISGVMPAGAEPTFDEGEWSRPQTGRRRNHPQSHFGQNSQNGNSRPSSSTGGGGNSSTFLTRNRLVDVVLRDPKKISAVNAEVNRMTKDELIEQLKELKLSSVGNKDVVKKRLKMHLRKNRAVTLSRQGERDLAPDRHYDFLIVIDFECTCEDGIYDYAHEIIEFPAVLLKTSLYTITDSFHAYVKPKLNSHLSAFCTELTGISQEQVDKARPFLDVLDDFRQWLALHSLGTVYRYAIVTDGPWDMGKFFQMQCLVSGLPVVPHDLRYWINIRRAFANLYRDDGKKGSGPHEWRNLSGMLAGLQMTFEGREHSGADDAKNIARIAIRMLKDGCDLRINERLLKRKVADKVLEKRAQECDNKRQVLSVSKQEFLMDLYEDCLTCSEPEDSDAEDDPQQPQVVRDEV